MRLPLTTRMKLAQEFGIPKTGSTHVANNMIQSDGYDLHHVEKALNLSAIQIYLKTTETNMDVLWNNLIDTIEGRTPTPSVVPVNTEPLVRVKRKYTKHAK